MKCDLKRPWQRARRAVAVGLIAAAALAACNRGRAVERDPDRSGPAAEERPKAVDSVPGDEGPASASRSAEEGAERTTEPSSTAAKATPPGGATAGPSPSGQPDEAPQDAAEPVKGDAKATDAYGAWLQTSGRYVAGKKAAVSAVVVAKGDFKCNEKYPFKFKLGSPPAGVTYPETTVRGIQYGAKQSVLSVPFIATKAGKVTISGKFYVSVCNATTCKMGKQPLSITVDVEPAS